MWDKKGNWRPQDYSLHYTYSQIGDRPTDEAKINFIDNLFNTVLERSHSNANFSDLRAELVDHYVSELGEDFHMESGRAYKQRLAEYHQSFGGAPRINAIAKKFIKAKKSMIRRQFIAWFMEQWKVHIAFLPLAYALYRIVPLTYLMIGVMTIILLLGLYERIKYSLDSKVIAQSKSGHSSAYFFYKHKLETFGFSFQTVYLFDPSTYVGLPPNEPYYFWILPVITYVYAWMYYYHIRVCQRRVAPLLEQYKSQLI